MSALPLNLMDTAGFLVADNRGPRVIGKVECPMYGTLPDVPDALSRPRRLLLTPSPPRSRPTRSRTSTAPSKVVGLRSSPARQSAASSKPQVFQPSG